MRKSFLFFAFVLAALGAWGQAIDSTLYVKQFPGVDVGTKLANAMKACVPNVSVPCILVIEPSLTTYAGGVMPSLCAQCVLKDYRNFGGPVATMNAADYGVGPANADNTVAFNSVIAKIKAGGVPVNLVLPCGSLPHSGPLSFTNLGTLGAYTSGTVQSEGRGVGFTIQGSGCATLVYTGTSGTHQIELGSTTAGNGSEDRTPYVVDGVTFLCSPAGGSGACPLSANIYVEPYVVYPVIKNSTFIDSLVCTASDLGVGGNGIRRLDCGAITLAGLNWAPIIEDNMFHSTDVPQMGVGYTNTRTWINMLTPSGNDNSQPRVLDNLADGYTTNGLIARIQGAALTWSGNQFTGGAVLLDASAFPTIMTMGFKFESNLMECMDQPCIVYRGVVGSITVDSNYANMHSGPGDTSYPNSTTPMAFIGPYDSASVLVNSSVTNSTIASVAAGKELVTLNSNVGSGNLYFNSNWLLTGTNAIVPYPLLTNVAGASRIPQTQPGDVGQQFTAATVTNYFPYSEPLLSNFSSCGTGCSTPLSGGVTQASFAVGGFTNGVTFPVSTTSEHAYMGETVCGVGITCTLSAYVIMQDAGAPWIGGVPDFYLLIHGSGLNNTTYGYCTFTQIAGSLWRVSASWTVGFGTVASVGVYRNAGGTGRGFSMSGFQLEVGTGVASPYNKSSGSAVPLTALFGPAAVYTTLRLKDEGVCSMTSGACGAQNLAHTYAVAPNCLATWTGTGTLTGLLKVPSTVTTVTPASSVGTDTAQVNWFCVGN